LQGAINAVVIVSNPQSIAAVADTDGKLCVYYSSGYKIKNRLGVARTLQVFSFGGAVNI
jgi:hypothetical protein